MFSCRERDTLMPDANHAEPRRIIMSMHTPALFDYMHTQAACKHIMYMHGL